MSMYGKYPKVLYKGEWVEQNGLNGAPKAWPSTDCSKDPLLTVQANRDEVDINKIMKKIEKGQMVTGLKEGGTFEDISQFNGLADAIIKVQDANNAFMELSAEVRARFDNDPVKLVDFLGDDKNRKEAESLGLIEPIQLVDPNRPDDIQPAQPATVPQG